MGDVHELKCQEKYFEAALNEGKTAEFRLNDRDYKQGDVMVLNEVRELTFASVVEVDAYYYEYEKTGRAMICLITNVTKINDVHYKLEKLPEFVVISFRVVHVGERE